MHRGRGERNQHPIASAGLPRSFHQLEASQAEQNSSGEKPIRVKRRRTRRERNDVKFGRNGAADSVPEQRPGCRGLQKALPPFWSSQLTKCASFKGIGGAKPVIITQNRLSQHLGMFNKEVKSVNIERLLDLGCKQDFVEATPLQRDSGVDMHGGEESQTGKSVGSDQTSVPCERLGSSVNNLCGTNECSLPIAVPTISAVVSENCSTAPVKATDPGSRSSAAPAVAEVNQQSGLQSAEADPCQSNGGPVVLTHEKENIPPVSPAGGNSHRSKPLARELAHDLEKRLNLKAIFPGRNLINETRQSIIGALLEQNRKLPDFSVLARYKKLAGGSKGDAVQADFKTPASRDQELQLESKSSGSSRNSSQDVFPKKRRGRDPFFLTSPVPSFPHTAVRKDEGRPSLGEDTDFIVEPDRFNQQSFGLAAVRPHPHPLSSRHVNSTGESSLASERQRPLQEALLRTAWPWEQGMRDALWEPRSRQERAKVAHRALQKRSVPQRHCMPFSTWDSWSLANASMDERRSSQSPVVGSQQYSYINELGSEQWSLQEPAAAHGLHLSQDQWDSQTLGAGLRPTDRAAAESQTSFDVLKSIWSPNVPGSVPRALGYPFLAHQPPSLRELNSDQEEFLPLYNVNPEQNRCLHRQNPLQEIRVPGRQQVFSGLAKPRTHRQKAALEPGRISNSYQLWGPPEASVRAQGTMEKGCPCSRMEACSWERLSHMEDLQQLRLFQQLPMSYFPPSEALENKQSPLHHLLGHSSPEPWAFPRMKLY